ncbi:MAG: hypothetical protein JW909_07835 [Planctomycetes bacterium]|nr:hypothetical protein [Planctomycetota bacterium]
MSSLTKIFVVVNLILAVAFCFMTMTLYAKRVDYKDRFKQTELKLAETETKYQKQVDTLETEKKELKDNNTELQMKFDDLSAAKDRVGTALEASEARVGDLESTSRWLTAQNKAKDEALEDRANRIQEMHKFLLDQQRALEMAKQHEINATNNRIEAENQLNSVKDQLTATLKEKRKVEEDLAHSTWILDTLESKGINIAEAVTGADQAMPSIPAKVLAVDKDVNLVMLSVGQNDGVKKGYSFSVYRKDKFVGKVRIEKVYDDMCAGVILASYQSGETEIEEGDDANTRLGY